MQLHYGGHGSAQHIKASVTIAMESPQTAVIAPADTTPSPLVDISDLALERGAVKLFSGLNLTIMPRSLVWVQGPNGSGKSSLLRAICDFVKPIEGTIQLDRSEVSYLGHQSGLVHHSHARSEALFWTKSAPDFALKRRAGQLSEGQRKRIAIDRIVAEDRRIWLLDEPYAALDDEARGYLDSLILSHIKNGGCAVVVSHSALPTSLTPTQLDQLAKR